MILKYITLLMLVGSSNSILNDKIQNNWNKTVLTKKEFLKEFQNLYNEEKSIVETFYNNLWDIRHRQVELIKKLNLQSNTKHCKQKQSFLGIMFMFVVIFTISLSFRTN